VTTGPNLSLEEMRQEMATMMKAQIEPNNKLQDNLRKQDAKRCEEKLEKLRTKNELRTYLCAG
jgi:hypothetical protein